MTPGGRARPVVSLVVPVFNEEDCIREFHRRATAMFDQLGETGEIVFVDDGSRDKSLQLLTDIAGADPSVRVISFSRNFGHQIAVTAGIDHAHGDAVVVIDADLQDPPEVVPELVAQWRKGGEVVVAVRSERKGESRMKLATASLFYRLIRRWTDLDIHLDAGDFRLLDRKVVDTLRSMPEGFRFMRGLTSWVGYDQRSVDYVRDERFAGITKYPVRKMVTLAVNAITSFSFVPLQLASLVGFVIAMLTGIAIPIVIALRIAGVEGLGGQTTVLMAVLFFGGVQLSFLGLIGEYLGRMAIEVKRRPLYVIRQAIGFTGSVIGSRERDDDL
jgi:polyisoprenyl-phosphate glycosyltransferase